jgi:hypothetical protein
MSDSARNYDGSMAREPPRMSAYDWMCFTLSRRARAYFELRNAHYVRGGFNFDAVGTIDGDGGFAVPLRMGELRPSLTGSRSFDIKHCGQNSALGSRGTYSRTSNGE